MPLGDLGDLHRHILHRHGFVIIINHPVDQLGRPAAFPSASARPKRWKVGPGPSDRLSIGQAGFINYPVGHNHSGLPAGRPSDLSNWGAFAHLVGAVEPEFPLIRKWRTLRSEKVAAPGNSVSSKLLGTFSESATTEVLSAPSAKTTENQGSKELAQTLGFDLLGLLLESAALSASLRLLAPADTVFVTLLAAASLFLAKSPFCS